MNVYQNPSHAATRSMNVCCVRALVHMLKKVGVDHIGIDARKRDDQMRREPALILDGNHRRQFALDILEDGKRDHAFKGVEFVADHEPFLNETEAMQRRFLRGVERERAAATMTRIASR